MFNHASCLELSQAGWMLRRESFEKLEQVPYTLDTFTLLFLQGPVCRHQSHTIPSTVLSHFCSGHYRSHPSLQVSLLPIPPHSQGRYCPLHSTVLEFTHLSRINCQTENFLDVT